ncbi:1-deoxy-D-xylulose-5-phosphate synthase [Streptomyces sp. NPDC093595]|uniref:1-deoxy-D-xylulose-5-phosphate synthase n=1 Tax=Streptomyces sp. NPDC093595 TaxID=3366045 RepID=UPI0038105AE1
MATGSLRDTYPLLAGVAGPQDLRALPEERLPALSAEIRRFLIEKVCATGGHLGPNLGVVELTIALHRVFVSPRDAIVLDTGHQGYVHKILTGRASGFDRLRQAGGLSGYPSRAESPHDWCENSHASASLSYADGLAKANELHRRHDRSVVAVIGDGAMTGGMAWEALNNIGAARRPVIVVLNDNGRSYAPTTGAIAGHLHRLKHPGSGSRAAGRTDVFTSLGFTYLGPIDGHHLGTLQRTLRFARDLRGPVLVHVATTKGKGYGPAEEDEADRLHAVGTVDAGTGRPALSSPPPAPSWTSLFGQALLDVAGHREDIVAITASMLRPTGLYPMASKFPERVFDVGIAEQHAVTSAAGLALGGFHPVVAVYATFLTRAADQVLMDVALHRLPITFVLDRAGITGPDGASHHGIWDLTLLGMVPGMRIAAPRDATRLRALLHEAVEVGDGPTALRLPKADVTADIDAVLQVDGMDVLHRSTSPAPDVLLVAAGPLAGPCLTAADDLEERGYGVTVVDPRWLVPLNPALLRCAAGHRLVVTVEDHTRAGGFGMALTQGCQDVGLDVPVRTLGVSRAFVPHGPREDLLAAHGLDATTIADRVRRFLGAPDGTVPHHACTARRTP